MSNNDSSSNDDSSSEEEVVVAPPPKKRAKKERVGPKKALSAYMLFCKAERSTVKENNPEAGFGELGKLLGAQWKGMDDDDKEEFKELALVDKQRYLDEGGEPAGSKKKNGTKKKAKKAGPKRPLSAFMFFSKKQRPLSKEENPELDFAGLGRAIGAAWKACDDDDNEEFNDSAKGDKQRYEDEKVEWEEKEAAAKQAAEEEAISSDEESSSD